MGYADVLRICPSSPKRCLRLSPNWCRHERRHSSRTTILIKSVPGGWPVTIAKGAGGAGAHRASGEDQAQQRRARHHRRQRATWGLLWREEPECVGNGVGVIVRADELGRAKSHASSKPARVPGGPHDQDRPEQAHLPQHLPFLIMAPAGNPDCADKNCARGVFLICPDCRRMAMVRSSVWAHDPQETIQG